MEKISLLKLIETITVEILSQKKADKQESAVKLPVIVTAFKEKGQNINDSTLSAYLSKLARIDSSPVKSAGKKKGFYYSPILAASGAVISSANSALSSDTASKAKEPRALIEKKLYDMVGEWLETEGYSVDVTADRTANGKWGNPDVTGIKVVDTVAENKDVEIITVEIKSSLDQWKQYIFEAVSHTRFANLTYYCFAYPEANRNSVDQELYLYAEEFGIGLLGIEMEQEDFDKFLINQYDPKFDEVDIIELQTPRFKNLRPYFREKFLQSLGIESLKELILWPGKDNILKPAA